MASEGGEDVAHHAGAGPGVEDRCPVAGPHVAAKEPACNRRGSVSPTQHAPLVTLRPAIVDLCSLLAALGTERALQMLGPASITQISASELIVSLPEEPASSMPNIPCTLHDSACSRQTTKTLVGTTSNGKKKSPVCRGIRGALGRTRTCDLLIRSWTRSRTGGDRKGHGGTKPRFYQNRALLKGQGRTGRDTGLWYRCGTKGSLTYSIGGGGRVPRRSPPARTSAPSAPSGTLPRCSGTSAARTQTPTTRPSRPDGSHRISRPTTPRTSSRSSTRHSRPVSKPWSSPREPGCRRDPHYREKRSRGDSRLSFSLLTCRCMYLHLMDLVGVFAFAVSGALTAGRKGMDLFGVLVVAAVTAIGGGTVRDVLLDQPVFWLADTTYLYVIAAAAVCTLVYARFRRPPHGALLVADAFGLAVFAVLGVRAGLGAGVSPLIAVIMGAITGVVGGAVRDVLSGETPLILRPAARDLCDR